MHISIAPNRRSSPDRRYPREFPSSGSSVIPFAEPKAIAVTRVMKLRNSPRNDRTHVEATMFETAEEEIFTRIDGRRTKDFQRRPRHKMRGSHEENVAIDPEKKKKRASINKKKPKALHSKGDALINDFSVDHLTKDRLTVCKKNAISAGPSDTDSLETTAASISPFWDI